MSGSAHSSRPQSRASSRGAEMSIGNKSINQVAKYTQNLSEPNFCGIPLSALVNDERFEQYNNKRVEELRKIKKEEINKSNFDEGQFIEAVLQFQKSKNHDDVSDQMRNYIKDSIEDIITNYKIEYAKLILIHEDNEKMFRKETKATFDKLKSEQLSELEGLFLEKEVQIVRDRNYEPTEYKGFQEQAKKLATANDFDGARQVLKKAEKFLAHIREQNEKDTKKAYDKLLKVLVEKQEKAFQSLESRLITFLEKNQSNKDHRIGELQKSAAVSVNSILHIATTRACAQAKSTESKKRISLELTKYVSECIRQIQKERDEIFDFLIAK